MPTSASEDISEDPRSDAELIDGVRNGATDDFAVLFERHRAAATRLARSLADHPSDADDLVSESFTKVLGVMQNGGGPDESFRAYLLTAMRRLHIDRIRSNARVRPTDDEATLDRTVEWVDPAEMTFDRSVAARAFATLPERWQLVLWHLEVEHQRPAQIAPLLGLSANSVSALAYRAREGLREAYLQEHLAVTEKPDCADIVVQLGAHVRGNLPSRRAARVDQHLDTCVRCLGICLELRGINRDLGAWLAPLVLGTAATTYASAAAAGGAGAGIAGIVGQLTSSPGRLVAATGGATAVVAAAAVGLNVSDTPTQDPPPAAVSAAPAPAPAPTSPAPEPEASPEPPPAPAPVSSAPPPAPSAEPSPSASPPPPPPPSPSPEPPVPPEPRELDVRTLPVLGGTLVSVDLPDTDRQTLVRVHFRHTVGLATDLTPGWSCAARGPALDCSGVARGGRLRLVVPLAVVTHAETVD